MSDSKVQKKGSVLGFILLIVAGLALIALGFFIFHLMGAVAGAVVTAVVSKAAGVA